jgi:hypothetical protein
VAALATDVAGELRILGELAVLWRDALAALTRDLSSFIFVQSGETTLRPNCAGVLFTVCGHSPPAEKETPQAPSEGR